MEVNTLKKQILTIILILSFVVLPLSLIACEKNSSVDQINLVEVTHSVFYAPQYVAINNGYFKDEGIDITLTNGAGADKSMTAILAGQADIGLMGPEAAIYVTNEGVDDPPIVFGQLTQRDGSFLVGRQPEPNFSWANLKGATIIGGRKGGVPEMTLEYVVKSNGLIPGENIDILTNIEFGLMAGAFTGGEGDYVTLFEPVATAIEQSGEGYIVASVGASAGEIPYTAYMARESYLKQNTALVSRFLKALYRGQQFVANESAVDIAEAIQPSFPDSTVEDLAVVVERYRSQDTWGENCVMAESAFSRLQDIIELAGELDTRADYSRVVDTTYAENIIPK
jgi:NitT/TauT family transport system substrate-binding protein